jgi:molybdenum cofactor synthesis domain-containing protein
MQTLVNERNHGLKLIEGVSWMNRDPSAKRTAAVITLSDGASRGERKDVSGDTLVSLLESTGFQVVYREVLPDERSIISATLRRFATESRVDCIITTGGTGVGPRDVTPEATRDVIDRELPGMAEAMRMETLSKTPFAMISRQVAGVCRSTLIVNLPGNPKAVSECFEVIRPVLPHVVDIIMGNTAHKG